MDTWRTDDMALAAFLCIEGNEMLEFQWELDSCFFLFEETDDLLDAVADFVSGDARVDPRRYNMQFGSLKRRMFASKPATKKPAAAAS